MTSIAGKYQHYKNEDIDDYFTAVGVPYVARKMMSMSSPLMEISVDGDYMTIKNSSLLRTVENKFKLGEEYEENMPNATVKSVTTLINEKQMVTKSVVEDTGANCARQYDFTEDECIVKTRYTPRVQLLESHRNVNFKAFVVRVPNCYLPVVMDEDFWPQDVVFRRFRGQVPQTLTHEKAKTPAKRYFRRVQ